MKRLLVVLALGALALTAACGSDDDPSMSSGGAGEGAAAFNDADVMFAQNMIVHHRQAIEMAEMALEKSDGAEIKDLAERIVEAQGPEIEKLQGWLEDWDQPEEAEGGMEGMDDGGGMEMMSDEDMADLEEATGAEFDTMFLEMMIVHHKGAVKMAEAELEDGKFADAKTLAQEIIDTQEGEITEMEELLSTSSGSGSGSGSTTTP